MEAAMTKDNAEFGADPGRDCKCMDPEVLAKCEEIEYERWLDAQEPRCCSICDGMGHGYPGGGPCPLENTMPWHEAQADLDAHDLDEYLHGGYGHTLLCNELRTGDGDCFCNVAHPDEQ